MAVENMEKPQSFHDLVCRLIDLGYFPVPIPAGCKGPTISGWDKLRMTKDQVPQYFNEPNMLVGVLHVNNCFFDIDVYCPELAEHIASEGRRRFPGALERIGQYPKTALVLGMDECGFKVANTVKGEADIDGKHLTAQVEVRTITRQAVVYGVHPGTGELYKWVNGPELWETPVSSLPIATKAEAQAFRDWADEQIKEWAGVSDDTQKTAEIVNIGMFHLASGADGRATEEQFMEALKYASPHAEYDTWLQCLMAIHDFYGASQAGLTVAQQWSSDYHNYSSKEVENKWRSFEIGKGTSYKTAFALAKQNGADLSTIARLGKPKTIAASAATSFKAATGIEEPEATQYTPDAPEAEPNWPTPYNDFDEASIEPRQWV